ncbi:MAG: MoaD/ThiS family protein [Magnetovibrio sp.]|nr:MoaD/ThiS family protein [Magnetovibrio sp.]
MKITLKLFSVLAKHLPEDAVRNVAEVEVEDGVSVQGVIEHLNLPTQHCHLVLVNGVYIAPGERAERILKANEALAIWPPVAGG